jgi:hypothetical protein
MKRFFMLFWRFFITCVFLWVSAYSLTVYGVDLEAIKLTDNPIEENTEVNIKWAHVIENYLVNYKKELESFQDLYWLKNDAILNENMNEIKSMIFGLRKIQTNKVEKSVADKVMSLYIERIKDLNIKLKKYLQNMAETAKEETKKYQDSLYKNSLSKFAKSLDIVISILKKKTEWKRILSKSETLYNQKILNLETENKKVKNFDKLFFKNKRELWKIKKELQAIQNIR